MKKNERLQALLALTTCFQKKKPLELFELSPFSKELCFGVCRHEVRLEVLALRLMKTKPKLDIWIAVLLGLYQLHVMQLPEHAVVQETVHLANLIKKPWAKGLINAVLRTYCREKDTLLTSLKDSLLFQYNHPEWLIELLQTAYPNDWQSILKANDAHPPMTLRVNKRRTTPSNYLQQLQKANMKASKLSHAPSAIRLETPCPVHDLPGFSLGEVSVQDEAAQLAAFLLSLKPGLRVLDACSAPGGKLCHLLETTDLKACVALDMDALRMVRIQENLSRLGLNASVIKGDAAHPNTWWDGHFFHRILLDAPCSATGVIRRHPDIKILRTPSEIQAIQKVQHNLLEALWPLLAPNGILLYATCSVIPEENEGQISHFLAKHADCQCDMEEMSWGRSRSYGWQILPGDDGMDGFYYCRLRKTELS